MSAPTKNPVHLTDEDIDHVANRTIADLVEHAPGTMAVFSSLGLDMCCGGAHPLGEALKLHGIESEPVLRQVASIVSESQDW